MHFEQPIVVSSVCNKISFCWQDNMVRLQLASILHVCICFVASILAVPTTMLPTGTKEVSAFQLDTSEAWPVWIRRTC